MLAHPHTRSDSLLSLLQLRISGMTSFSAASMASTRPTGHKQQQTHTTSRKRKPRRSSTDSAHEGAHREGESACGLHVAGMLACPGSEAILTASRRVYSNPMQKRLRKASHAYMDHQTIVVPSRRCSWLASCGPVGRRRPAAPSCCKARGHLQREKGLFSTQTQRIRLSRQPSLCESRCCRHYVRTRSA